MSSCWNCS